MDCVHCMFYVDMTQLNFRFYSKFNYKVVYSDSIGIGKKAAIQSVCIWSEDLTQDLCTYKPCRHIFSISPYTVFLKKDHGHSGHQRNLIL